MERRRGTESTTDSHDLMDLDSQNDSMDLMNMTTQTEASPGPALVSNSSQDSDFLTHTPAGAQRDGGDVATGPSIREAEAFADQMARELLDNSDSTVRRSSQGGGLEANVVSTAQEVVDSAIVEATQTISLKQGEKTETSTKADGESSSSSEPASQEAKCQDEREVVVDVEKAETSVQDQAATKETTTSDPVQEPALVDDREPIVKEKKLSVNIGPVTYQYSADSLDESQIEQSNKDDAAQSEGATVAGNKDEEQSAQKMDLEHQTAAAAEIAPEEEDKENVGQSAVKREQAVEHVEAVEQQQHHELDHSRPADDSWVKQHDASSSEPLHQTFKTAFNASQNDDEHREESFEDNNNKADTMEFTKNYSDDLLMGAGEQQRATNNNDSADLADFELPPYNGSSSSGSEQAATSSKQQQSPAKRKSSNSATQASSTSTGSSSDLTAVKNILISSYSKGAHVFHWRKPIESGIIFAIGLALIAALTFFSIISVVAYSALGVVLASGLIRIYKTSMKALNRSAETPVDHIWEKVLGLNVSMSPERMHKLIDSSHANLNASLVYFKQVLLVEDKVATLKFFLFLYALTYIGAWFNGLTLITIIYVSVFSVPIIYEKNKTNIDQYLNLATDQISSAISLVTGRVSALIGGQSSSAKKHN